MINVSSEQARILDGILPEMLDKIQTIALEVPGIVEVTAVRARWLGHRVHAEVTVSVDAGLTVSSAHELAEGVENKLMKAIPVLSGAAVHLHPAGAVARPQMAVAQP